MTQTARYPAGSATTITGPLGQATMAASIPVVIASNQTAIPVSGTVTATNASVSTTGSAVPASATMVGGTDGTNLRALAVSAAGVLSVDASATTQPVSGTVAVSNFPATQPVSGTVTVTQGTNPWGTNVTQFGSSNIVTGTGTGGAGIPRVTVSSDSTVTANAGSGTFTVSGTVTANAGTGTLAVSAASLPLPSGAATAAKQPALGTAGTASADVITVQGIASMTALKVDGSGVTQPVSGTVTANAGTGTFTTDQITATATFQDGAIAFGSLTTNFATVITTGGALKVVQMRNNTNGVVVISLDGGSTTAYTLDSGDQVSVDLKSNGLSIPTSTALQAKYSGSAPTSGSIRINGVR